MERKDLMIGDYVIYDGQVYRVTMIGQTSVAHWMYQEADFIGF